MEIFGHPQQAGTEVRGRTVPGGEVDKHPQVTASQHQGSLGPRFPTSSPASSRDAHLSIHPARSQRTYGQLSWLSKKPAATQDKGDSH